MVPGARRPGFLKTNIMRNYKFIGKRKDNGEWVTGSYHYCDGAGLMRFVDYQNGNRVVNDKPLTFDSHWILVPRTPDTPGWNVWETFRSHDIIPGTVGQFIGIADIKGCEVFEGHVLKGKFGTGMGGKSTRYKEMNYAIGYSEHSHSFFIIMPEGYGDYRFCPSIERSEIVGNIHDHPHLLNPLQRSSVQIQ